MESRTAFLMPSKSETGRIPTEFSTELIHTVIHRLRGLDHTLIIRPLPVGRTDDSVSRTNGRQRHIRSGRGAFVTGHHYSETVHGKVRDTAEN